MPRFFDRLRRIQNVCESPGASAGAKGLGLASLGLAAALGWATPASAQLFWLSPTYPVQPLAAGSMMGTAMPDASPEEAQAATAWQMRAALNVMAMQCQFEPTLVAASSYRTILVNHRVELAKVYAVMNGYFNRVGGSVRAGQAAMDKYDTKNYSAFSAVAGQMEFCSHTARLATQAAFLPAGQFTEFATGNLQSTYASLKPVGDLYFYTVMTRIPVEQDVIPSGRKRR